MDIHHPPFDRLADLAEGRVEADDRGTLQRHVSDCARCLADVEWLTDTIGLMRTDNMESPPEHVVHRAVRLFRQHRIKMQAEPAYLLQRLVGMLRFDSAVAAPAVGLRVGTDEATRQLVFDAQPYEVELRMRTTSRGWAVVGQLLGPAESVEAGDVELIGADTTVRASLTELLEFSLPSVPAGTYRLELHVDERTNIEIPSLELGP